MNCHIGAQGSFKDVFYGLVDTLVPAPAAQPCVVQDFAVHYRVRACVFEMRRSEVL